MLLYNFHQSIGFSLIVTPFMDSHPRGVFSTRAPKRPNPIGISVVRLIKVEESNVHVENVDMIDQTPLLDIKPYVPEFDHYLADRIGWLEKARGGVREKRSDNRFKSFHRPKTRSVYSVCPECVCLLSVLLVSISPTLPLPVRPSFSNKRAAVKSHFLYKRQLK